MDTLTSANKTVIALFSILIVLIVLLVFLYKKLNKEANGEYTIRHMVFKEGGVRDQVRTAALGLETRLGVQLWPRGGADEDGEEMQEVQVEEAQVEKACSQGDDGEGDDQGEDEEEDSVVQCSGTEGKDDYTSDDNSSLEDLEADEETRLTDPVETKGETEEKESGGEGEGEAGRLSIDLKQFSGNAIWSEEGGQGMDSNVTAL